MYKDINGGLSLNTAVSIFIVSETSEKEQCLVWVKRSGQGYFLPRARSKLCVLALRNRLTEAKVNGLLHKFFKPWKFISNFLKTGLLCFPSNPYQNRKGNFKLLFKKQYKHVNRVVLVVLLVKQKSCAWWQHVWISSHPVYRAEIRKLKINWRRATIALLRICDEWMNITY